MMTAPGALVAGRYRLVNQIAAGGMGLVWEARDELLQRRVAMKQLLPQPGVSMEEARTARDRVIREARITARLHHPHAVTLYDVVEQAGRPCLIMEFVPSRSLNAVLKSQGTLQPAVVARIGAELASALAAAHQVGIVHRDVKPSNVLITDTGSAKLTDFGISHAVGDVSLTSTGMVTGTPAYLAPEVARGADSGFPADVFSLGATLYAALEGTPPFGTDINPMAILHRVASGQLIPPRRSGRLTPLLLRMLSREPADRPTMTEVASSLTVLQHEPVRTPDAPPSTTIPLPPTPVRDRPGNPSTREWTGQFAGNSADQPAIAESDDAGPLLPLDTVEPAERRRPVGALLGIILALVLAAAALVVFLLTQRNTRDGAAAAPPGSSTSADPGTGAGSSTKAPVPPASGPTTSAGKKTTPGTSAAGTSATKGSATTTVPTPSTRTAVAPPVTSGSATVPTTAQTTAPTSATSTPTTSTSSTDSTTSKTSSSPATTSSSSSTTATSTTRTSTTSSSSSATPGSPTAAELAAAITDYYALLPGNTDQGWERLTARFQTETAKSRVRYQRYWDGMQRVEIRNTMGAVPNLAGATITYYSKSGTVTVEDTVFTLVREGGVLKIDTSRVVSP